MWFDPPNQIVDYKSYRGQIQVESELVSGVLLFLGFKCDPDTRIVLDCKWNVSGTDAYNLVLGAVSDFVIGMNLDEVCQIKEQNILALQTDPGTVTDADVRLVLDKVKQAIAQSSFNLNPAAQH
ncbi:hypothetical protein ACFL96_15100 [Thermoproteota archaeon]